MGIFQSYVRHHPRLDECRLSPDSPNKQRLLQPPHRFYFAAMTIQRLENLAVKGQRVLLRQDLNVPVRDGRITSPARIEASLPTIRSLREKGARVMIMSHLGRPTEGKPDQQHSLAPVAAYLADKLQCDVPLITDYLQGDYWQRNPAPHQNADGNVMLFENVRFNLGERANDECLSKKYADLCDVYVMDAFATAHRAQASTHGVAKFATIACSGPLLSAELDALEKVLEAPKRPMVAIVGGAKVSHKLTVLESLIAQVDQLIPGGAIANTFIAAAGYAVGKSLYEPQLLQKARILMQAAANRGGEIPIPTDVVVAHEFSESAQAIVKSVEEVAANDLIMDIGPQTAERYANIMRDAGTILWNGPLGVFEFPAFASGTAALGKAIAESQAYCVAGGGDTLAAIDKFGLQDHIAYISTGGGAFLEFIEGQGLAGVEFLQQKNAAEK